MIETTELTRDRAGGNALLAGLPQAEWARLEPMLTAVVLPPQSVLYRADQTIEQIFFIQNGYVSLVVELADAFQAEVGHIGNEGMVGIPVVLGVMQDIASATVQTPATALHLPADVLMRALADLPVLTQRLLRYAERLREQAMQLAACNGHHGLECRLARCLLGIHDRHSGDAFPVTHETLATLLCAHRPSVSVAVQRLQRAGLIRYASGSVVILDRDGLERAACECYGAMQARD